MWLELSRWTHSGWLIARFHAALVAWLVPLLENSPVTLVDHPAVPSQAKY